MKTYAFAFALVLAPLGMGCGGEEAPTPVEYVQSLPLNDVTNGPDGPAVAGSTATVTRTETNLDVMVTSTVTPGDANTLWLCGFNEPTLCRGNGDYTQSCSEDEMPLGGAPSPGDGFCLYAGGQVAAADGSISFEYLFDDNYSDTVLLGDGLKAYLTAELNITIRTHGPALEGAALEEQLSTVSGSCAAGEPNEGLCANVQTVLFSTPEM